MGESWEIQFLTCLELEQSTGLYTHHFLFHDESVHLVMEVQKCLLLSTQKKTKVFLLNCQLPSPPQPHELTIRNSITNEHRLYEYVYVCEREVT